MSLVRFSPSRLRRRLLPLPRREEGMSTAEYAVGTVAVVAMGIVFMKFLSGDFLSKLIFKIIQEAFKALL